MRSPLSHARAHGTNPPCFTFLYPLPPKLFQIQLFSLVPRPRLTASSIGPALHSVRVCPDLNRPPPLLGFFSKATLRQTLTTTAPPLRGASCASFRVRGARATPSAEARARFFYTIQSALLSPLRKLQSLYLRPPPLVAFFHFLRSPIELVLPFP